MTDDVVIKVESVSKTFVQHNRGKTVREKLFSIIKTNKYQENKSS